MEETHPDVSVQNKQHEKEKKKLLMVLDGVYHYGANNSNTLPAIDGNTAVSTFHVSVPLLA